MLVQFALVIIALCGLLSLVVDAGLARVTQSQLQSAADTAAIEGLRKRDLGAPNANGQNVNDPFASDCQRRAAAARLVRWTFDDDFDRDNGDPYAFGAGPVLDVDAGVGDLHGGRTTRASASPTYKPDLQLNQGNSVYGDMVSGRFCYSDDPLAPEGTRYADPQTLVCSEGQRGAGTYARSDFNPSPDVPQPPPALQGCPGVDDVPPAPWPTGGSGSLDSVDDSAFLVRLRRSNEFSDAVAQTEDGIATSGPSLPLTFGMGTLTHADPSDGSYSVRRDGLTVRGTAIAQTRPASRVGLPQPAAGVSGVTPFTLVDTYVAVLPVAGCPVTVTQATGLITSAAGTGTCPPAGTPVGRFIDNPGAPLATRWRAVSRLGAPVPAAVATAVCPVMAGAPVTTLLSGYGPVYSLLASGTNRVVGFAGLRLAIAACVPGATTYTATVFRTPSRVAAENASAAAPESVALPQGVSQAELAQLLDRHFVRNGARDYAPILAAVLAR